MVLEYLLGGVFIAAIVSVVGFWWYRYPRQARVVTVEAWVLLGTFVLTLVLVERLTADGPPWLSAIGIAAHLAVWLGLVMPISSRRFERLTRMLPPELREFAKEHPWIAGFVTGIATRPLARAAGAVLDGTVGVAIYDIVVLLVVILVLAVVINRRS